MDAITVTMAEVAATPPARGDWFYILGYWPPTKNWSMKRATYTNRQEAEDDAEKLAKRGWQFLRIVCVPGEE